jgi:SET domain-containing protein
MTQNTGKTPSYWEKCQDDGPLTSMSTHPTKFRVAASPIHGRGVFARTAIRRGTLITSAPALVIENDPGETTDYVFDWDGGATAIALGALSLCNHSQNPNAEVVTENDEFHLIALRTITPGEEILIDYGPDHPVGQNK